MGDTLHLLLRQPLGGDAADADLAAETLMAAAASALRPGHPQDVTWRHVQPGDPARPGDPALALRRRAGRPLGGSGELECVWHGTGGPVVWAWADAGPTPHYAELWYTLYGRWRAWADDEFARWVAAVCPLLAQWEPWIDDRIRGQRYPWRPETGYLAAVLSPEDGGPVPADGAGG